MSEFKKIEVIEQVGTFDGKFKLAFDSYLLMKMINHMAAEGDDELADMENPKRLVVRVIIETKEI